MINSKVINWLKPYLNILEKYKNMTLWNIKKKLNIEWHEHFKKWAWGLIVENILWIKNNNDAWPDLPDIWVEIKVLPITINISNGFKAKEPTQIKMINFMEVAKETRKNASIRKKIETVLWIVYWVPKKNWKFVWQSEYILLDYFIDKPIEENWTILKKDWEMIQSYIVRWDWDRLSCSMWTYIEPKTKGKNNQDKTVAPDWKWWKIMVRRRAFYFKRNYTNKIVIPQLNITKKIKK